MAQHKEDKTFKQKSKWTKAKQQSDLDTNKMMTAVDWLKSQIEITVNGYFSSPWVEIFKQAKEMEKEQIMKAVYDSMGTTFDPNMGRAEQYYNETYNK
jgi:hypothetical protein